MINLSDNLNLGKEVKSVELMLNDRKKECRSKKKHLRESVERIEGDKTYCFCAHCSTRYSRSVKNKDYSEIEKRA